MPEKLISPYYSRMSLPIALDGTLLCFLLFTFLLKIVCLRMSAKSESKKKSLTLNLKLASNKKNFSFLHPINILLTNSKRFGLKVQGYDF